MRIAHNIAQGIDAVIAAPIRHHQCFGIGHTHETGCAVKDAVADGLLDTRRWESCSHLATGDDDRARRYMLEAAGPFAMDHYMGRVAQLHCQLRGWSAK
jgi:hypothetical protein